MYGYRYICLQFLSRKYKQHKTRPSNWGHQKKTFLPRRTDLFTPSLMRTQSQLMQQQNGVKLTLKVLLPPKSFWQIPNQNNAQKLFGLDIYIYYVKKDNIIQLHQHQSSTENLEKPTNQHHPIHPWQSIRGPLQLPFSIPRSHRRGRRRHDGHLLIGIAQVATDAFVSHGVETCHRARKRTGAG